jgi:hypothetical protein
VIYDIGDKVTLSTVVRNEAGTPVNTPTVVIAVTKPDGTLVSPAPTVTNTASGGVYTAQVTVDQADTWTYVWTASGSVVAVEPGQFTARAPRVYVVSLEEFKVQLNRTDDTDDLELRSYLAAATRYVESRIGGPLAVTTFTERHHLVGDTLIPRKAPLVSVTSVTPDFGSALAASAYTVDTGSHQILFHFGASVGWYTVVYRAGGPQGENVRIGGAMVAQHLWETQNGRAGRRVEDLVDSGMGFAVPKRAAELLSTDEMSGIA